MREQSVVQVMLELLTLLSSYFTSQSANQVKGNFWKACMYTLNKSSCLFAKHTKQFGPSCLFLSSVWFCPAAFCRSIILVQRLVPNGHWCLNFNFAEGGRKKKKQQQELLTSELRSRASSLSVNWQRGKKRERNGRQFLHASLLERTTWSCSRTYRADI